MKLKHLFFCSLSMYFTLGIIDTSKAFAHKVMTLEGNNDSTSVATLVQLASSSGQVNNCRIDRSMYVYNSQGEVIDTLPSGSRIMYMAADNLQDGAIQLIQNGQLVDGYLRVRVKNIGSRYSGDDGLRIDWNASCVSPDAAGNDL